MKKVIWSVGGVVVILGAIAASTFLWMKQGVAVEVGGVAPAAKVERPRVVEVFSYGCGHCYSLEPALQRWREEHVDRVEFARVPYVMGREWLPFASSTWLWARTYYALESMNVPEEVHEAILEAVTSQSAELDSEQRMADFVREQGVDRDAFAAAFESDAVSEKVRQAKLYQDQFKVRMTPTFVVNDSFRATIHLAEYSTAKLLQNVDGLVAKSVID